MHKPIKLNGYKIGWLNVYSTGRTKCAVTMHAEEIPGRDASIPRPGNAVRTADGATG